MNIVSDFFLHRFNSEIKLQLLLRRIRLRVLDNHVCGWFQTFGHQLEVCLVEDNLGQVLLSFDLFFDCVRDVWDHVGQDELCKVNNVLRGEEEEDTSMSMF